MSDESEPNKPPSHEGPPPLTCMVASDLPVEDALASAVAREEAAFRVFVRETKTSAFNFARALVGGNAAPDLLQEAYTAFWRNLGLLKPNPRGYLFCIIKNKAIDVWRRRSHRRKAEEEQGTAVVDLYHAGSSFRAPDAPLEFGPLEEALSKLTPRQRASVVLTVVQGYSHEEVAEFLGCETAHVANYRHRGLLKLKHVLEKEGGDL
jgi:RNA polymerase sigma-70 factor (ECF subfamily)